MYRYFSNMIKLDELFMGSVYAADLIANTLYLFMLINPKEMDYVIAFNLFTFAAVAFLIAIDLAMVISVLLNLNINLRIGMISVYLIVQIASIAVYLGTFFFDPKFWAISYLWIAEQFFVVLIFVRRLMSLIFANRMLFSDDFHYYDMKRGAENEL